MARDGTVNTILRLSLPKAYICWQHALNLNVQPMLRWLAQAFNSITGVFMVYAMDKDMRVVFQLS